MDAEVKHFKTLEESHLRTETVLLDETADIESLRSAYWAVVGQSRIMDFYAERPQWSPVSYKAPGHVDVSSTHQGVDNVCTEWASTNQYNKSNSVNLFRHPQSVLGIICLGIASCFVCIVWGYSDISHKPVLQSNEPIVLLNLQETEKINSVSKDSGLNHVKLHSQNSGEVMSGTSLGKSRLLTQVLPTGNDSVGQAVEKLPIQSEPTGRADPFAPLVSFDPLIESGPNVKADVFANLQYTGFVGDINSKEKMALIKVNDPASGTAKTIIKKEGEAWLLFGESVNIKSISKDSIYLSTQGEYRHLPLQPFQTAKATHLADGDMKNKNSSPKQNADVSEGDDFENEHP